jgi:small subunit ribosomal protein S6e|tara:strand:- start:735 stop:1304 length:570 start_codon:yes stop_codon:yes gene_type:complete
VAKSKLIVADPKNGKSIMYELTDDQFRVFKGLKIGSDIDGSPVNVEGKLTITGGSDHGGFPMRNDVLGGVKKYVLLTKGVGFRSTVKGLKRRKLVRGNTITEEIYQINALLTSKPTKKSPAKEKEVSPDIKKDEDIPKKEGESKEILKEKVKKKQDNESSEKKSVSAEEKKMKITEKPKETSPSEKETA